MQVISTVPAIESNTIAFWFTPWNNHLSGPFSQGINQAMVPHCGKLPTKRAIERSNVLPFAHSK
jgi:hypothetical protein